MMQLFADVSGVLALLFFSIIGWMISKWTHGRFAAFMKTQEAKVAKLQKIDADADASLLADSAIGGHEAPRFPLVRSNLHNDTTEKSPQLSQQNNRRARRRAKAAKLEANVCPAEVELVMSSQAEISHAFTPHSDQKPVSAVVVASTVQIEEQIDESKADLIVLVPEVETDRLPAKEEPSEEGQHDEVLPTPESIRTLRTETEFSDETKLCQSSVSNYPAGEEQKKPDTSLQIGSSTQGDSRESVSSEDDSMLSKSSLASASQEASEPTPSIPTYPPWMSSADSRFPIHGDGWMTSFGELQFAQSSDEPVFTPSTDAQGSKSYTEGELVYESTEQTPVAAIHSEHAFVIEGCVFTPFTDVHGQHWYTDGKIVYHATRST